MDMNKVIFDLSVLMSKKRVEEIWPENSKKLLIGKCRGIGATDY